MNKKNIGIDIHNLCKKLWPLNRSITGNGTLETLIIISKYFKNFKIHKIKTGTNVFNWTIPDEWNIKDAWIKNIHGKKVLDFKENNLHVVGYSIPIKAKIEYKNLKNKIFSLPSQKNAIPYVTSYYKRNWGFCMSDNKKKKLKSNEKYEVFIDSKLKKGHLNYGELIIKGRTNKEIFLSSYICHPSLANNELSGPTILTFLAKWLTKRKNEYTYRLVFVPETIGSIAYLSKNLNKLKKNVIAGYNLTCLGDERTYSYLPSRSGNTISDKIALHILKHIYPKYKKYSWNERGSDERQYCSPGVDLPIATIMRSKYGEYPEYHTSLDNLKDLVTPKGLSGGYEVLKLALEALEKNCYMIATNHCEPQLSKKNLIRSINGREPNEKSVKIILAILTWADGNHSLLDIAEKTNFPIWEFYSYLNILKNEKLIKIIQKNK